jgi:hypothetical protein
MSAGRAFSETEIEQQALVAIVNETAARALWPDQPIGSVIGRTVTTQDGPRVVVGVAADIRIGLARPESTLFLPLGADELYRWQRGSPYAYNSYEVMLRMAPGRVPDRALLSDTLRELPWMPPRWVGAWQTESVAAELGLELEKPKMLALIFGTLAGITLLLTVVAIYGLASFEVRRRRYEMTVRLALGATSRALRRRLAVVTVRPVMAGILIGLPAGGITTRLLSLSVPVVDSGDPRIYAAAAATVLLATLIAAWLPGRRTLTMRAAELRKSS